MNIDLKKIPVRDMEFDNEISIPEYLYKDTDILDIKDVNLQFNLKKDNNQEYVLSASCNGKFILSDARTLEEVEYPFSVKINEILNEECEFFERFLKNNQNTLDIIAILWENIVLEIPISFTVSNELESSEFNGWEVVGEESNHKIDPRLAPLMELLDKEKE